MTRRYLQQTVVITLAVTLLATTIWGFLRLSSHRQQAAYSAQDIITCQQLAARIDALKTKPQLAAAQTRQPQEIARIIEQTAQRAAIAKDCITNIWPEAPRRAGDSVYLEKPTRIDLRRITLKQLISFLDKLTAEQKTLNVKTLRLSSPPDQDDTQSWHAELTLTYLIYSPKEVKSNTKQPHTTGMIH